MAAPLTTKSFKSVRRKDLRVRRELLASQSPSADLRVFIKDLPQDDIKTSIVAGYAPIGNEINVWPLLEALFDEGQRIALPVVMGPQAPLAFREWSPGCHMATDRYGVSFPAAGQTLTPQFILVPLLAFTPNGDRLGYGGGYYDRTLAALRSDGAVFACGVAYAGQEVVELPTDPHDAKLDGILTETGFKAFQVSPL